MSTTVVDIVRALRLLDEIEGSKGSLYERFGEALAGQDLVQQTFIRLGLDQTSRHNVAAYQTRIAARNAGVFQGIKVDSTEFEKLRQVVTDLHTAPAPVSPEQAVTVALAVETRTWELFEHELFGILATHFGPFVASLRKGCERHIAQLGSLQRTPAPASGPAEAWPAATGLAPQLRSAATNVRPAEREDLSEVTAVWRDTRPTVTPAELLAQADPQSIIRLLDRIPECVYVVDRGRRLIHQNAAARRFAGKAAGAVGGERCTRGSICPVTETGFLDCRDACSLKRTMRLEVGVDGNLRIIGRGAQRGPASVHVNLLTDASGAVAGSILVVIDQAMGSGDQIGELERLAYLDALTGLANRRYLEVTVISRLNELQRYGREFGVIFIDVDGLKAVNDSHGHGAGDEVLRVVADTLSANLRTSDLVGRWGGDEFLGVVATVGQEQLYSAADKLREILAATPCQVSGATLRRSVSIGATVACPEDTLETLIARSDRLMFLSKAGGRNRVSGDASPRSGELDLVEVDTPV